MRNSGKILTLVVCLTLAATLGLSLAGPRGDRGPHRYAPRSLDQEPVLAINPADGTILAAWGYREGGEYSIALAVKSGDVWTEPVFIGRDDGLDQIDPALVFDSHGVAYLAFTELPLGEVRITAIAGEPDTALLPRTIARAGDPKASPALSVIADRLVVAFNAGNGVVIRDIPLFNPEVSASTQGIQEGPDAVDPLGWFWIGNGRDSDEGDSGDRWQSEDGQDPAATVPLGLR
ncbi:MAG: hypothetical protein IFK94_07080 [Acidobacteria bacterium]|uniref:Uncharacterized protein n=1 Tax=Candidatus Polarisedimenticola svalbardensis TaxID=2886004 RepID=A0A8J6Y0C1_9BACT|nr:hypothetical protein [Candidatus Polarisedimenticola svalbardensis]